jgi:hypothetical protein
MPVIKRKRSGSLHSPAISQTFASVSYLRNEFIFCLVSDGVSPEKNDATRNGAKFPSFFSGDSSITKQNK